MSYFVFLPYFDTQIVIQLPNTFLLSYNHIPGTLELSKGDILNVRTMEPNMTIRLEEHRKATFKFILLHSKEVKTVNGNENKGGKRRRKRRHNKH